MALTKCHDYLKSEMRNLFYILLISIVFRTESEKNGAIICGVILANESSEVVLCNNDSTDIDISCYTIAVNKTPIEILSQKIPKNTILKADSFLKIEIPFLDFPFRRNGSGNEKFKKYYLFNEKNELICKFNMRKSNG